MFAIALTFISYLALISVALGVLFLIGIFLFDGMTIILPNKHSIQITKK
ncbi:MAG: hypothetical protein HGA35_05250 [Erysipelotrichaceae bacterium]|nr:hypothetical protein [Erysipelotrichaceae bacterium]